MINESGVASIRLLSKRAFATVAALLFIGVFFAASAFAGSSGEYDVIINDNGEKRTVTTNETEPIEILNEAKIKLGSSDKLCISSFEAGRGGTIVIDRLNSVNIKLNDVIKSYQVYADTVGDAFTEIGISAEGCKINYSLSAKIEDGMIITVANPKNITLEADGASVNIGALGGTVGDMLAFAGITLGENDYVEPAAATPLEDKMVIKVFRVEIRTETEIEQIKFETETRTDDSLEIGETRIEAEGENGEKTVQYEIRYVNGEEDSRKELSSEITKEPTTEIKVYGTKTADVVPNGIESRNGLTLGQTISGKYTHYCQCSKCCGKSNGITASGKRVYTGMPNPYYIACNWLPLGSVVQVDGINYTVVDRGGSGLSSQGRIDIFSPGGHAEALRGGTGKCSITILRFGW